MAGGPYQAEDTWARCLFYSYHPISPLVVHLLQLCQFLLEPAVWGVITAASTNHWFAPIGLLILLCFPSSQSLHCLGLVHDDAIGAFLVEGTVWLSDNRYPSCCLY